MNRLITPRLATFAAAALLAAGAANAQSAASAVPAPGLNFQQVVDRVVAQGYSDIREVEREGDKLYEIKARDGQGRRVELKVDARSGEILRTKEKR